ncbi:MAG: class I SAM-dependent methyltransferase [Bacteroidetes bacterium]|nr:MAG: class I SAM-dependent methyltransferase [Bacteroidota bacterium]TAE72541.1 MAG: class I SAM-dependent methyltransferase [Bacteroidota bacterium]
MMYNAFELALKYIQYYITAQNGKGHGVHSPFVFEFIQQVLNTKPPRAICEKIEEQRQQLLLNTQLLTIEDMGAGSAFSSHKTRSVKSIAKNALKAPKYSQLMHQMVAHYNCQTVLELGTSLGITTSYLATAKNHPQVLSFEGATEVANQAQQTFERLNLKNIQLVLGNFDHTLQQSLQQLSQVDLAFIDGNHRYQPTVQYFEQLLTKTHAHSMIIFDDIYWSKEMEQAWAYVKNHSRVSLTIDLFFIGIAFFRTETKVKEHYTIRF